VVEQDAGREAAPGVVGAKEQHYGLFGHCISFGLVRGPQLAGTALSIA